MKLNSMIFSIFVVMAFLLPSGAEAEIRCPGIISGVTAWNDISRGHNPFDRANYINDCYKAQNRERRARNRSWRSYGNVHPVAGFNNGNYGYNLGGGYGYGYSGWREELVVGVAQAGTSIFLGKMTSNTQRRAMDQSYKLENRLLDIEEKREDREYERNVREYEDTRADRQATTASRTNRSQSQNKGYFLVNNLSCEARVFQGNLHVVTLPSGGSVQVFVKRVGGSLDFESRCAHDIEISTGQITLVPKRR